MNYKELKKVIENGSEMMLTQSGKGEIEKLKMQINDKERIINEQNKVIEKYEAQIELMRNEKGKEDEDDIKKEGGLNNEIVIEELNRRLKELTEEIDKSKNEINQQCIQNTNEMKQRYQKEFELVSSAMYNLGFNFWSMKYDYEQKMQKQQNWLIKQREVMFNGDF